MSDSKLNLLTEAVRKEIDVWIAKYPSDQKKSAVMAALRIVQENNKGYLTNELMDAIAEYLAMRPISVYEVASFYSMYELQPVGETKIAVCTNVSCQLRGSDEIVAHLNQRLGIKLGETTEDNKYTLKEVECLGACGGAPMLQIGNTYYEDLTVEKVDQILDSIK